MGGELSRGGHGVSAEVDRGSVWAVLSGARWQGEPGAGRTGSSCGTPPAAGSNTVRCEPGDEKAAGPWGGTVCPAPSSEGAHEGVVGTPARGQL